MGGRVVSVPGLASRELMLSSYFLFLKGLFCTYHRSLLPVTALFVMFDIGDEHADFPCL